MGLLLVGAAGRLISYGPNFLDLNSAPPILSTRSPAQSKPVDIPVGQPTKFNLVINHSRRQQMVAFGG